MKSKNLRSVPGNHFTSLLLTAAVVLLAQLDCNLDAAGFSTTLAGTLNPSPATHQWTYENLSRLKTVSIQPSPTSSAFVAGAPPLDPDRVGNATKRTGNLGAVLPQAQTIDPRNPFDNDDDPTPSTPNRSFDANGNTTSAAGKRYEYDLENRLIRVNEGAVQITYDGDGHRVRKTAPTAGGGSKTTWYLVDDLNPTGYAQVLEEWETSDSQPPTLVRNYTYGSDLISVRDSSDWFTEPTTHYYGHDGHGSVRFLTGETAAAITDTYTYDAFGVLLAQTPIDAGARTPNHYLYAGEQWDSDLGLYFNRARYLDPNLGRFWTMDTFEGNQSDPLSLHKYLYAHNSPLTNIDPSGHFALPSLIVDFGARLTTAAATYTTSYGALSETAAMLVSFTIYKNVELFRTGVDIETGEQATVIGLGVAMAESLPGGKLIRFAQKGISRYFRFGEFAGASIEQVADALRAGTIKANQLPVQVIIREGVPYTINNRSLMALRKAGKEPTMVIDVTGHPPFEKQLTKRLAEIEEPVTETFIPAIR